MKTKLNLLFIVLAWFAGVHQAAAQGIPLVQPYNDKTLNATNFYNAWNAFNNPTNPVVIFISGDSTEITASGAAQIGLANWLLPMMPYGGGIGDSGWGAGSGGGSYAYSPNVAFKGDDTNWFAQYYSLTNSASMTNGFWMGAPTYVWAPITNADAVAFAYFTTPGNAMVNISTLPYYGAAGTIVATINESNSVLQGVLTNIAVPSGNYLACVTCTNGIANCLALGVESRHPLNAQGKPYKTFIYENFAYGGHQVMHWLNVNTNIFYPIMSAMGNCVALFEQKNDVAADLHTNFPAFNNLFKSAMPNANQVWLATYQTENTNYDNLGMDMEIWNNCLTNNDYCISLYDLCPIPSVARAQGFWVESPGIHYNIKGATFKGGLVATEWAKSLSGINNRN